MGSSRAANRARPPRTSRNTLQLGGGCPPIRTPQPYPNRAWVTRCAVPPAWSNLGKVADPSLRGCCVTDLAGGFGTVSLDASGHAVVSQHLNEDGCDLRGDFYLENAPGGSSWAGYLSPIVSPSYLFPQVVSNPNGSFTLLGETPNGGVYDETEDIRVSYVAAAGGHFTCPTGWQLGTWTAFAPSTLFRDGRPAFPSLAVSSNGRVGVAVGDFGGNVYLIESSNGSYAPATVVIRKLTNYTDAQWSRRIPRDAASLVHPLPRRLQRHHPERVVWSELQARAERQLGRVLRLSQPHHAPGIRIRGVEVVKQVAAGEADHYDDVDNGLNGPLPGFNTLSVDWPQVGFSADGLETYVAWLRYTDSQVDPTANMGLPGIVTGVGFGDIALSLTRHSMPWSAPQNLTNTPQTDERYFSLAARNPDGKAHLVFQASATPQAGTAVIGDRGSSPGNLVRRIAYLERPISGTLVSVDDPGAVVAPRLAAWPNPSSGLVRFSAAIPVGGADAIVEVYSLTGRRVARVTAGPGGAFEWDGRDLSGREVATGVYFARLASDAAGRGVRFVRIH